MVTLTEKKVKLSAASHWLPLGEESRDHTQKEQERAEARATRQVDVDDIRVELTPPEHITGMGQLLSMLSNYVGDSNALFILSEEVEKCPITVQYFKHIFNMLHQEDVKDYIRILNSKERLDLFYHLIGQIDCFKLGMAKAGDEFTTNALITAEKLEEIDITLYQKVTTSLSDDLKLLIKASNGGAKINPLISV